MSCDVEIKIFGKVSASEPEAIWELAQSAATEGKKDYLFDLDEKDFVGMIEKAGSEGGVVILTRGDTTDFFESVRSDCQSAGLSYVVKYGDKGAEGFSDGISWQPGMDKEFEFLLDKNRNPVVRITEVHEAAKKGIEAVNELLVRIATYSRVGKIEVDPGFSEAYKAYQASPSP